MNTLTSGPPISNAFRTKSELDRAPRGIYRLRQYVEEDLSYREAGLGTRMKWWLFGKDD